MQSSLFVIERDRDGERQYWASSVTHGKGWHPGPPKQAFTRSEVTAETFLFLNLPDPPTFTVRPLVLPEQNPAPEVCEYEAGDDHFPIKLTWVKAPAPTTATEPEPDVTPADRTLVPVAANRNGTRPEPEGV